MLTKISMNQSVQDSCYTHLRVNNFFFLQTEEVIGSSFEREDDTAFELFGCLKDNENEL